MNTTDILNTVLSAFDKPILKDSGIQIEKNNISEIKVEKPIVYTVSINPDFIVKPKTSEINDKEICSSLKIEVEEIDNTIVKKTKSNSSNVSKTAKIEIKRNTNKNTKKAAKSSKNK